MIFFQYRDWSFSISDPQGPDCPPQNFGLRCRMRLPEQISMQCLRSANIHELATDFSAIERTIEMQQDLQQVAPGHEMPLLLRRFNNNDIWKSSKHISICDLVIPLVLNFCSTASLARNTSMWLRAKLHRVRHVQNPTWPHLVCSWLSSMGLFGCTKCLGVVSCGLGCDGDNFVVAIGHGTLQCWRLHRWQRQGKQVQVLKLASNFLQMDISPVNCGHHKLDSCAGQILNFDCWKCSERKTSAGVRCCVSLVPCTHMCHVCMKSASAHESIQHKDSRSM